MTLRMRRVIGLLLILSAVAVAVWQYYGSQPVTPTVEPSQQRQPQNPPELKSATRAADVLAKIVIKGRAPKTNYQREQFGDGWLRVGNCDMRNIILNRDLTNVIVNDECKVTSGTLLDPYTGMMIQFASGEATSPLVQIDHVVALSNAWQTGAQLLTHERRIELANDPLELLAVDGSANQSKGDGDAATWLPANKPFRCQYVARQIAVKAKYSLWVTQAEFDAMERVLSSCPDQTVPLVLPS